MRLIDDIDAAITEMLLVQTDKSLMDLKGMTPEGLESFKQSFLKLKALKVVIVDKCMADCAIMSTTSGKSKKEKIDYLSTCSRTTSECMCVHSDACATHSTQFISHTHI